jgi:hypothetical protein
MILAELMLMVTGLPSMYAFLAKRAGWLGLIGFVLTMAAVLLIEAINQALLTFAFPFIGHQVVMMLRTTFPDLHFTIEELVAERETVAGHVTLSGTHQGALMGIAPTGRSVQQVSMHFVRFRDGKGIERCAMICA